MACDPLLGLENMGWHVIRYWGNDIKNNLLDCVNEIKEMIYEIKNGIYNVNYVMEDLL